MKESVSSAPAVPTTPAPEKQLIETVYYEPQTILIPEEMIVRESTARACGVQV